MPDVFDAPKVKGDAQLVAAWITRLLLLVGMGGGAWLANQVWTGQRQDRVELKSEMKKLENSIQSNAEAERANIRSVELAVIDIKLKSAATDSNRFSSQDWTKAKELLDSRFIEHDKRLSRVEDASASIKESLSRLEVAVGTNHKQ